MVHPCIDTDVPADLRPYAIELYQRMRASPDMRTVTDDELVRTVCSEAFRSILVHYAAKQERLRGRP